MMRSYVLYPNFAKKFTLSTEKLKTKFTFLVLDELMRVWGMIYKLSSPKLLAKYT